MKINCIIIEDEPLAREKLADFVDRLPMLDLASSFSNAIEAIGFINDNEVDLIFLDIQMQKLNGIQFLESLTKIPNVIIVSAYEQYALKSYEFSVVDYLLKPYSFKRFMQAINKVLEKENEKNENSHHHIEADEDVLFVKSGSKIEKIELNKVLYVEGVKDYQKIVTEDKSILTLQTFREIVKVLPEPKFVRIHKSYVVAVKKIESIERNRIKIKNQSLSITDTYKEHFYEVLKKSKTLL